MKFLNDNLKIKNTGMLEKQIADMIAGTMQTLMLIISCMPYKQV